MAQGIEIVDLPEIPVSSTTNVIAQNPDGVGKTSLKNIRDAVGVSIDTVNASATTGLPGTEVIAKVKQTGTDQNKQFDFEFTIPKGDKGDKGGQFTEEEIKAIKVSNSVNSDQLGNVAAENYAKKTDVPKIKVENAINADNDKDGNPINTTYSRATNIVNNGTNGIKTKNDKFNIDDAGNVLAKNLIPVYPTSMKDLGFSRDEVVQALDFWRVLYEKFGSKFTSAYYYTGIILKFSIVEVDKGFITDGNNTVEVKSGHMFITSLNNPDKQDWSNLSASMLCNETEPFQIYGGRSPTRPPEVQIKVTLLSNVQTMSAFNAGINKE